MSRNRWITTLHSPLRILLGLTAVTASGLNTAAAADSDGIIAVHTIQPGEYLSKLAVQYYGNADDWEAIFEANPQLDSPNEVSPGDEIRLPELSSDEAADIADGEAITLVTSNDYHPFADAELRGHGLGIRVAKAVFEAAGYAPEIEVVDSWSIVERDTQKMKYDVAAPYVQTTDRQPYFAFSESIYPMQSQIFIQSSRKMDANWQDFDLSGLRACKPKGYYLQDVRPYMDSGFLGLTQAQSVAGCFRQLASGEVDFVPINRYTAWTTILNTSGLTADDFEHLPKPLARAPLRIMVSRDHEDYERILSDFNEALGVLKGNGRINEIRAAALDDFEQQLPEVSAMTVDGIRQPSLGRANSGDGVPTLYTANHYEPFADEDLPQGGMSTEVVLWAINNGFGQPPHIAVQSSWPDVAQGVLDGDAVAAFPYVETEARKDKGFIFSEPLHDMQVEIFVRDNDELEQFTGAADLSQRTLCKPVGYYMRDVREELDNGLIDLLEPRPDTAAGCMEALVAGDADFVSMNPNVAAGAIERADIAASDVRSVGAHARLDLHVMAADTDQGEAFVRRLDGALGAMAERGSLDEIRERHLRLFQQ